MADRPKREIKEPKWFYNEFLAYTPVKKANPQRKDTKLYDIEVTEVDKANRRLKIHYAGYSSRFNEWRPFGDDEGSEYFPFVCKEKLFIPSENSLMDRTQTFHGQLFREIKKKLWSGWQEDPEISIDLNVDQDVFMEGLGSVLPGIIQRGKMVYQVKSNRMLDPFFGNEVGQKNFKSSLRFCLCNFRNNKVLAGTKKSNYRIQNHWGEVY